MLRKLIVGVIGLIVVFISVGIAFANGYGFGHNKTNDGLGKVALHNITGKYDKFHKQWYIANLTESLGLPENATREEIKDAIKKKMETEQEQLIGRVKEKLGLPQNATDEELKDALNQWREENTDLIRASMYHKPFVYGNFFGMRHGRW